MASALIWSHNPPPLLQDSCPKAFLSPLCSLPDQIPKLAHLGRNLCISLGIIWVTVGLGRFSLLLVLVNIFCIFLVLSSCTEYLFSLSILYKLNIPIFVCLLCCMEEGQWWRHCSDREDLSSVSSGRDQHLLLNSAAHCPVSFKMCKVCTEICAQLSFTCG